MMFGIAKIHSWYVHFFGKIKYAVTFYMKWTEPILRKFLPLTTVSIPLPQVKFD